MQKWEFVVYLECLGYRRTLGDGDDVELVGLTGISTSSPCVKFCNSRANLLRVQTTCEKSTDIRIGISE